MRLKCSLCVIAGAGSGKASSFVAVGWDNEIEKGMTGNLPRHALF